MAIHSSRLALCAFVFKPAWMAAFHWKSVFFILIEVTIFQSFSNTWQISWDLWAQHCGESVLDKVQNANIPLCCGLIRFPGDGVHRQYCSSTLALLLKWSTRHLPFFTNMDVEEIIICYIHSGYYIFPLSLRKASHWTIPAMSVDDCIYSLCWLSAAGFSCAFISVEMPARLDFWFQLSAAHTL